MHIPIYTGPRGATAALTTDSPASHYGAPVLRIEGDGADNWPDMGPADQMPTGMYAADFVCRWAAGGDPGAGDFVVGTEEGRKAAAAFCRQWPSGPQVEVRQKIARAVFDLAVRNAKMERSLSPTKSHYWLGYLRGIRRGFYGETFGTLTEHERYLALIEDADRTRRERGQGYRDGIDAAFIE